MTVFLVAAAIGVVLVLALLMRPFLRKTGGPGSSHRELNAVVFREQFARLEQDLADGALGKENYAEARAELQRRVAEDTRQEDPPSTLRTPRKTITAIGVLMPVTAVALYLLIGNPASMTERSAQPAQAKNEQIERMVAGLEQKLQKEPGNLKGWAMLARSYKVMGRTAEAEQAFARAGTFIANDAQMLATYAEVAAVNRGGRLAGKPAALIQNALAVDPDNARALWLAGLAQREAGNFGQALQAWERLAAKLPSESDEARVVQVAMDSVRTRTSSATKGTAAAVSGRRPGVDKR